MKILAIAFMLCVTVVAASQSESSAQNDILAAVRARLAASARNDLEAWSKLVEDEMLATASQARRIGS